MAQRAFILILSNDPDAAERLNNELRAEHNHSCLVTHDVEEALASIKRRAPDVVVAATNVKGDSTPTPLLAALHAHAPRATLLLIGDTPDLGAATDGLTVERLPDTDNPDELVEPIGRLAAQAVAKRQDELLRESVARSDVTVFEGIVGASPALKQIIKRIQKAARNKLTVLILGETGVGKDLIARAIHNVSDRAGKPFHSLNCAGLTETLIESQLFGHVRGAFTGALTDQKGYFAAADGGTLFLDEIGDMPLGMQPKLLHFLQHREFAPVGSTDTRHADVRVIAATNVDLASRVEEHAFRPDLYYRLRSWVIEVPPLRERREDIPVLAHHFLQQANQTHELSVDGISSEAMLALTRHAWPGNVRELQAVVESAACDVETGQIELACLPDDIRGSRDLAPAGARGLTGLTLEQVERIMIEQSLRAAEGNREKAAKMLGIGTRTLYRKLKDFELE